MRHECSQPTVFFRQRDLPIAATRIERADELFFGDTAQHFVSGQHRVSVSDSEKVQIAIVTCDADTAIFLRVRGKAMRDFVILSTRG